MANIQFSGLASGLDTKTLIDGLVKAEQTSFIDPLKAQEVRYQAQQGILTTFSSNLSSLKSAAQALSLSTDFGAKSVSSSDSTVLTASADTTAQSGTYNITVSSLAKAKSLESTAYTNTTATVGQGTLAITVGTSTTNITVDANNNTLSGVKDAINNAGAGVLASIVNTGTSASPSYKLIVQSKNTGTDNDLTIAFSVTDGGSNPFTGGGDVVQPAANAEFSVNGLSLSRSSNTISDVIPGVTFSVQKDGGASSTLTVANDTSTIKTNIKKLVDAYNAVAKIARDQFSLDPTTGRQGALAGDSTVRGAISRLRSALSGTGGNGAGFLYLSDIGLRFQKDGSLSLDDAKLTSALASNPEGVKNLFLSSQNGIGKRVPAVVDSLINTVSGSLTARQNGITASIASLEKKIDREQQRIAAYQDQLVQQFSSLETLVSGFNQQSQYLSQKLSTTTIK